MDWAKFKALYIENWIPAWTDDNLDIWIQDIEKPDIEERLMQPALQSMANAMARRGDTDSPRMSHILLAYESAKAEDERLTPSPNRATRRCMSCGNSGYGIGLKNLHGVYVDPLHPAKIKGPLYMTLIPCTCPAYVQDSGNNFPMTVRQSLAKYIIAPMGNTWRKDDERCLTTVRDFQGACEIMPEEKELADELRRR